MNLFIYKIYINLKILILKQKILKKEKDHQQEKNFYLIKTNEEKIEEIYDLKNIKISLKFNFFIYIQKNY